MRVPVPGVCPNICGRGIRCAGDAPTDFVELLKTRLQTYKSATTTVTTIPILKVEVPHIDIRYTRLGFKFRIWKTKLFSTLN